MNSKRKFILQILSVCLLINVFDTNNSYAQLVNSVNAKSVAKNFFAERLNRRRLPNIKSISSQNLEIYLIHIEKAGISDHSLKDKRQSLTVYYIFNIKYKINSKDKIGYVIVSADQRIPCILGFSFSDEFPTNDQPPAIKEWMNYYKEQIIYAIQNKLTPDIKISDEWKKYLGTTVPENLKQMTEVEPLLTTKWSQRCNYNNLCPTDSRCTSTCSHVPAGCAAVAMAQIMKYWNYPSTNNPIPRYYDPENYDGNGTMIQNSSYGWLPGYRPKIEVTAYDWSQMSNEIIPAVSPTTAEINAVSKIIFHCGVAVQMNYGPTGSGAGSPMTAFRDFFKYSQGIQEINKSDYSTDAWENILKNELDNMRPVYYAGYSNESGAGGHAFVCDGYQSPNFFHFNFGFGGGGGDGYFYLNDLTPGTSYDFNYGQWADIGILPDPNLSVSDIDGNYYNTLSIGLQTWMDENLRTTKFNNGIGITNVTGIAVWSSLTSEAYCWYDNNIANKTPYGALYNWYTVKSGNLCPTGWHVPSVEELVTLVLSFGHDEIYAGGKLKEVGYSHWSVPNTGAKNKIGFTALPGGYRDNSNGLFKNIRETGVWWSSTESSDKAWQGNILHDHSDIDGTYKDKKYGFSVRCIKNSTPILSVAPQSISVEASSGSTGAFNVTSNTIWTVTDDADWLDLSLSTRTGNASIIVTTTSSNTSTGPRTANVTFSTPGISSVTVSVTQTMQ